MSQPALPSTNCPGLRGRVALLLLLLGAWALPATAQLSMLHAAGPRMENAANQEVILRGTNLGNFLVQEGYLSKPGTGGSQGSLKKRLYDAGMTEAAVEAFYRSYRANYITRPDINYIASKGFNCVRLPLHYELFLTASQRAVRNGVVRNAALLPAYVDSLSRWYDRGQLFTSLNVDAYPVIDSVLSWCAANNMYVVLDLHAAPGAQGNNRDISDALELMGFWNRRDAQNRLIYQDITVQLWQTISARYKNDGRVAMYDLINEPNGFSTSATSTDNLKLRTIYQRLITALRAQNDPHLLLLEGSEYGNRYDYILPTDFSPNANLAYSLHRYDVTNDVNSVRLPAYYANRYGSVVNFRRTHNVPMWLGEFGENTNCWIRDNVQVASVLGLGWCQWSYKRFSGTATKSMLYVPPPYLADAATSPTQLSALLQNIRFANCGINTAFADTLAPNRPLYLPPPLALDLTRYYTIQARHSGKNLVVPTSQLTVNGTKVQQTTADTTVRSQQWRLVSAGGGYYEIRSRASGKTLDVPRSNPTPNDENTDLVNLNGTQIQQWTGGGPGNDYQHWKFVPVAGSPGYYTVVSRASCKCLDVPQASQQDGQVVQQWTVARPGTPNQQWQVVAVGPASPLASRVATSDAGITLAPNPASGDVTVTYLAPAAQQVRISVVSLLGQTVQVQENQVVAGANTISLNTSQLARGLYLLKVANGSLGTLSTHKLQIDR